MRNFRSHQGCQTPGGNVGAENTAFAIQALSNRRFFVADARMNAPRALVDLTVVVVNYNVRDFLEQALESVERAAVGLDCEIIVVDNNSADGSVEMVRERFARCTLIANSENVGFSRANNQALVLARGRSILLLNPDTVVQEDTFRELIAFLEATPRAGVVGCRIINPDGSFAVESRRSFPTPSVAIWRILGLSRLFPRSKVFGRYNLTYKSVDEVSEVDALSGSCMLLRRAALIDDFGKAGVDESSKPTRLFDERFFMYGEDLDLCFRIQSAGWKLYYTPATQIIHYKGESTRNGDLRYVRLFYGAMLLFSEKHFHGRYSLLVRLFLRLGIVIRGGLSAAASLARRAAPILLDFASVFAAIVAVSRFRLGEYPEALFLTVAPTYAAATVVAMSMFGVYRSARSFKPRYAIASVTVALLSVAALSFFIKQIAFSRAVVLAGAPLALLLMLLWRRLGSQGPTGLPKAVIVGTGDEASRVAALLDKHPEPPFVLGGYVCAETDVGAGEKLRRLGGTHQLRDIVRVGQVDTVVFAAGSNTRRDIFGWMQELSDLPVSLRMLDTREAFVVGKSSIDQLSLDAFIEARAALGIQRRVWSHRAFDLAFAVAGILASPFIYGGAALGNRRMKRAATILPDLPSVIFGKRAVVGFDELSAYRPPVSWRLRPGIFPAVAGTPNSAIPDADLDLLYVRYAMHQSASVDWAILRDAWNAASTRNNGMP
jgi:hypothetical protein